MPICLSTSGRFVGQANVDSRDLLLMEPHTRSKWVLVLNLDQGEQILRFEISRDDSTLMVVTLTTNPFAFYAIILLDPLDGTVRKKFMHKDLVPPPHGCGYLCISHAIPWTLARDGQSMFIIRRTLGVELFDGLSNCSTPSVTIVDDNGKTTIPIGPFSRTVISSYLGMLVEFDPSNNNELVLQDLGTGRKMAKLLITRKQSQNQKVIQNGHFYDLQEGRELMFVDVLSKMVYIWTTGT